MLQEFATASKRRALITRHLHSLLGGGGVLVVPSAPGPAPPCNTPAAELDDWRRRLLAMTCVAGLAGLPQVCVCVCISREWQGCYMEGRVQGCEGVSG